MEAEVAGEFGGGRHNHIGLSIGLSQAHLLHQTAKLRGQADAKQAFGLATLELGLRAARKIKQHH
jgi:hypothetical protein